MSLMHFDDGQIRRKSIFAGPQRMVMKNSTRRDNNAANQAIIVESKPDIQHRVGNVAYMYDNRWQRFPKRLLCHQRWR